MWKKASLVILAAWIWGAGAANAAYVIKLNNGNEYVTTRYWQRGSQVLFDSYGGVFGVDKAFVGTIKKTDRAVQMTTMARPERAESPGTSEENTEDVAGPSADKEAKQPTRDANDPIMKEFNQIKSLSQNLDRMLSSELFELSNRLTALKKKLQLEGKTNEYLSEFGAIHELGGAIEAALNARR